VSSLPLWLTWFWFTNRPLLQLPLSAGEHSALSRLIYDLTELGLPYNCRMSLSLSLMLRPTVSRPVSLGIKHPFGAYVQIFVTVRQLRVCWCGALSLTRGRVCRLQLLLALASTVVLGSESRGIRDHILLSKIRDFPFRRLLRLVGLRWRYSTPPPHGSWDWIRPRPHTGYCRIIELSWTELTSRRTEYKSSCLRFLCYSLCIRCHRNVLTEPLLSSGLFRGYSLQREHAYRTVA
jgi:hypothetical protein